MCVCIFIYKITVDPTNALNLPYLYFIFNSIFLGFIGIFLMEGFSNLYIIYFL